MRNEKTPPPRVKARRIQASELTAYHYCARALGYQRAGAPSENREALDAGFREHAALSRRAQRTRAWVTLLIILLILSALSLYFMIRIGGMTA